MSKMLVFSTTTSRKLATAMVQIRSLTIPGIDEAIVVLGIAGAIRLLAMLTDNELVEVGGEGVGEGSRRDVLPSRGRSGGGDGLGPG